MNIHIIGGFGLWFLCLIFMGMVDGFQGVIRTTILGILGASAGYYLGRRSAKSKRG